MKSKKLTQAKIREIAEVAAIAACHPSAKARDKFVEETSECIYEELMGGIEELVTNKLDGKWRQMTRSPELNFYRYPDKSETASVSLKLSRERAWPRVYGAMRTESGTKADRLAREIYEKITGYRKDFHQTRDTLIKAISQFRSTSQLLKALPEMEQHVKKAFPHEPVQNPLAPDLASAREILKKIK